MGKDGFVWDTLCILCFSLLHVSYGEEAAILIFADGGSIHRSLLNGSQHHVLPLNHIQKAKFIEFDPQDSQIYWADITTRQIWRTDLCGEDQYRVYTINGSSYTYFISLALDYKARTIYWTNTGYDIIERVNLDGNGHVEIATEKISSPKDLEIDLNNGYLYWLDGGLRPKIERSKLDGSGRQVVFDLMNDYPTALALDVEKQMLYWNNANDQSVWMGGTNGEGKRQLASSKIHSFPNMIGISVLGNYLYWESLVNKRVERMVKFGSPVMVDYVVKGVPDIQEVKAVKVDTKELQCAPVAPRDVKVKDITNSSVVITWLAGYDWGSPQKFRVDLNTSSGWSSSGPMVPSSTLQEYSQRVTGLVPNRDYQIRVKACNEVKGCNKDRFDSVQVFTTKDVETGEPGEDSGFISQREKLIIIIVAVVVGVFILIVLMICIIKCAMRNKLSKEDYLYLKRNGGKPAQI